MLKNRELSTIIGGIGRALVGGALFGGVGAVEGAASAIDLKLADDDIKALEEFYEPHFLSGVMAQNTPFARTTEQVWIKNGKYAKHN